jgi:hypothetical protein
MKKKEDVFSNCLLIYILAKLELIEKTIKNGMLGSIISSLVQSKIFRSLAYLFIYRI